MHQSEKLVNVLLVEDNPADIDLAREVLETSRIHLRLSVVTNGVDCLQFLRREGGHGEAPRPDLILLDLNLPGMNGREILDEIKRDPALRFIPVVVLTSSAAEQDVLASYNLGANCFVTKPVDLEQFTKIVNAIEDFWLTIVKLPKLP